MAQSITRHVQVSARLAAGGTPERDFGRTLCLVKSGSLDDITTAAELRLRRGTQSYADASTASSDFPLSAGGAGIIAAAYFAQDPLPKNLLVGWQYDSAFGDYVIGSEVTIAGINSLGATAKVTLDGSVTGNIDFTAGTVDTVAGAATALQTALRAVAGGKFSDVEVFADGNRLCVVGGTSRLGAFFTDDATAQGLGLSGASAETSTQFFAAESTPTTALTRIDRESEFYQLVLTTDYIDTTDVPGIATWVSANGRMLFLDTSQAGVLQRDTSTYIAQLQAGTNDHVVAIWSRVQDGKAASMAALLSGVDYNGIGTMITLKFKGLPGTRADDLTDAEYEAITGQNANVFATLDRGGPIVDPGVTSAGAPYWADTVHGLDKFEDSIRVTAMNHLRSLGRVPMTDDGIGGLRDAINLVADNFVQNGLFGNGTLRPELTSSVRTVTGNTDFDGTLETGYLTYVPSVATLSTADREARRAPPIHIWGKIAGAAHSVGVTIQVGE